LFEYKNHRQPKDVELSKGDGGEDKKKLQDAKEEVGDFEYYSHGLKNIKEIQAKEMEAVVRSPYDGQRKKKAELDIEIDELWKLMMKKAIRWNYQGLRKEVSHKF